MNHTANPSMSHRVPAALSVFVILLLSANVRAAAFVPAADTVSAVHAALGHGPGFTIGYNFTVGATAITVDALGLDLEPVTWLTASFPPSRCISGRPAPRRILRSP